MAALLAELQEDAIRSIEAQRDLMLAIEHDADPGTRSLLLFALSSRESFVDQDSIDRLLARLVLSSDGEFRSAAIATAIYEINFAPAKRQRRISFLNTKSIGSDGGSTDLRFSLAEIMIRECEDTAMTSRVLSFLKSDVEVAFKSPLVRVHKHLPKEADMNVLGALLPPTEEEAGYGDLDRKLPEGYQQLGLGSKLQAAQALIDNASDDAARRILVSLIASARESLDPGMKEVAYELVTGLAHRAGFRYTDLIRVQAAELLPAALRVEKWMELATRGDSALARAVALVRIFEDGNLELRSEILDKLKGSPQINQRLFSDLLRTCGEQSNP